MRPKKRVSAEGGMGRNFDPKAGRLAYRWTDAAGQNREQRRASKKAERKWRDGRGPK